MSASTKLVEKLEGIDNFRAWKYRIGLMLAENDLAKFIKEEMEEPEDAIEKSEASKRLNQGSKNHCRFNQRPPDPVCIVQENSEGDV
jgi:hypothetical protein